MSIAADPGQEQSERETRLLAHTCKVITVGQGERICKAWRDPWRHERTCMLDFFKSKTTLQQFPDISAVPTLVLATPVHWAVVGDPTLMRAVLLQ